MAKTTPHCVKPTHLRPPGYVIPFPLLGIPVIIKRHYSEEEIKRVEAVELETNEAKDCHITLWFSDDKYDEWTCPRSQTDNNWQAWRGWRLLNSVK